jgi:hypothetical protein
VKITKIFGIFIGCIWLPCQSYAQNNSVLIGLGLGNNGFSSNVYTTDLISIKEKPSFSPECQLGYLIENGSRYFQTVISGGYNRLAKNVIYIEKNQVPGGATVLPYYGKDFTSNSPFVKLSITGGLIVKKIAIGIGGGVKYSTPFFNTNTRYTDASNDFYYQVVDVTKNENINVFARIECVYSFKLGKDNCFIGLAADPMIVNKMKQNISVYNLRSIPNFNIEQTIKQPLFHLSVGLKL